METSVANFFLEERVRVAGQDDRIFLIKNLSQDNALVEPVDDPAPRIVLIKDLLPISVDAYQTGTRGVFRGSTVKALHPTEQQIVTCVVTAIEDYGSWWCMYLDYGEEEPIVYSADEGCWPRNHVCFLDEDLQQEEDNYKEGDTDLDNSD